MQKISITKKDYLENKFSHCKINESYIFKCLNRDILDFQEFTKEKMRILKTTQVELISILQDCVNSTIPDFEIKLFGSHATNLCLQWSDLDIVLVNKKNALFKPNINILNQLYLKILVNFFYFTYFP